MQVRHTKFYNLLFLSFIVCSITNAQQTTKPLMPVMARSNEATNEQLDYARAEGDSVDKCIGWILKTAGCSGKIAAGEYKITYAFTKPEGWYEFSNDEVSWHKPEAEENAHLWLFVQDGSDSRIVPPLNIKATIINEQENVTDQKTLPFAWMPMLNGYGENVKLSESGKYTLNITIAPPAYRRHDPYNGDRFKQITTANIPVTINPQNFSSQPLSEEMESHQSLAKGPGKAYNNTLKEMYKQANDGRDTITEDYRVTYAIEYAEGFWHYEKDKFRYMAENDMSGKTNAHVEVAVLDAKTGRFIYNLDVKATLKNDQGEIMGTLKEPFMWHPWLYHYGENWRVPKAGKYDLLVNIKPPSYRRYGKTYGNQFLKPVVINFNNIIIKTGQK